MTDTEIRQIQNDRDFFKRKADALATPARNCDKYATAKEAEDAFFMTYFGPTDIGFWEGAFIDWLFSADEKVDEAAKKGGNQ